MSRVLINRFSALFMTAALLFSSVATVSAAVWTDQADYSPGSVVTISGDNSNDAGYLAGETVDVAVSGPNGYASSCDAVADDSGAWSCQVTLWASDLAVGDYTYTATGQESGATESGTFTDAVNLSIKGVDGGQHQQTGGPTPARTNEEDLGSVESGNHLVLLGTNCSTVPYNGLKVSASGLASGVSQAFSFGYATYGATDTPNDNSTLSPKTTLTETSGSVTGSSDFDCIGLDINSTGLTAGTTYHGTLRASGTGAGNGFYLFKFAVVVAVPLTGTLRVTKIVSGGNKTAADFQFDVSGPTASSDNVFEGDGTNDLTVDAGTYTVTEDLENGYSASYSNCTGVSVAAGGTTACTVTNTFVKYASSTSSLLSSVPFEIGGSVTDTATVTGDADGGDPTGEVRFYLCGPTDPSGAYPDCSSGGTLVATDNTLTDAGTDMSSASSGAITPTAAGKYCFRAEYQESTLYLGSADYDSSECFIVNPASATVVYLGQFDDADGAPTTLSATVTSSYEPCASSRQVTFALDGIVTDYLGVDAKTATTGSATGTGPYTGTAATTETLAYDIYDAEVSVADKDLGSDGIPECSAASDPADIIITVAEPGSSAHGGGWYKDDTASPPRVNFGFTVKQQKDLTYKGQILWMNNASWKLKGTIDGFGFFVCPAAPSDLVACGLMTGTGTLYQWNGTDWVNPQAVSFSARFWDGGFTTCAKKTCNKQERPDYFGMQIATVVIAPESDPMRLWGGALYGKPL